jgi:DNA invertase Pin-like site-specific DNA recombinase
LVAAKEKIMGRNHKNRIVSEVDPIYANENWQPKVFRAASYRVAAYTHVSPYNSDQENSLKDQQKYYETILLAHPTWEYVGLYADDECNETSIYNRKEFNRMVEDCKEGKIDLIIVKKLFCFSWKIVDCLNAMKLLLTLHPPVGIHFENDNISTLDTNNKSFLAGIAIFEELKRMPKSRSI